MTGLVVTRAGWAAVHLPAHRTRTLDLAGAPLGIHAVTVQDSAGLDVLDRLLTAARRQAAAIAGHSLTESLTWAAHRLTATGSSCPGMRTLLPEWMDAPPVPVRAKAGRAQLVELEEMQLQPGAVALLQSVQPVQPVQPEPWPAGLNSKDLLANLVFRAAAVVVVAAVVTDRYRLPGQFGGRQLSQLLDDAAGDLLPFRSA